MLETNAFNNPFSGNRRIENTSYLIDESDTLSNLAWDLTTFGGQLPYTNLEWQVDLFSKAVTWGDRFLTVLISGLETSSFMNHLRLSFFMEMGSIAAVLLKIVTVPFSIFFALTGGIQLGSEAIQLKRVISLIDHLENSKMNEVDKLKWVQDRYFRLNNRELHEAAHFIETSSPHPKKTKQERFELLAKKMLHLKEAQLSNRITPALTEALKGQCVLANKELQSPETKPEAIKRIQVIFNSIIKEAKLSVFVHGVTFAAIGLGFVATIVTLVAFPHIGIVIAFSVSTIGLYVLAGGAKWGCIPQSVPQLYDTLKELNLELPEYVVRPRNWLGWLGYYQIVHREELNRPQKQATS